MHPPNSRPDFQHHQITSTNKTCLTLDSLTMCACCSASNCDLVSCNCSFSLLISSCNLSAWSLRVVFFWFAWKEQTLVILCECKLRFGKCSFGYRENHAFLNWTQTHLIPAAFPLSKQDHKLSRTADGSFRFFLTPTPRNFGKYKTDVYRLAFLASLVVSFLPDSAFRKREEKKRKVPRCFLGVAKLFEKPLSQSYCPLGSTEWFSQRIIPPKKSHDSQAGTGHFPFFEMRNSQKRRHP